MEPSWQNPSWPGAMLRPFAGALAAVTTLAGAAHAVVINPDPPPPTPLPAVQFYDSFVGVAGAGPYPLTAPGYVQVPAGMPGGTGDVYAHLGPSPYDGFTYDNVASVGGDAGGSGNVDMTYYVEYYNASLPAGNPNNVTAHVLLGASDLVQQFGAGTATAALVISGGNAVVVNEHQCVTGPGWGGCGGGAAVTSSGAPFVATFFNMVENQVYSVELIANGYGGWNVATGPGSATASVDPTFSTTATGGAFFFSPGVGGVPEPTTWAMFLAGVGAIGAALRISRRRQLGAAAAA